MSQVVYNRSDPVPLVKPQDGVLGTSRVSIRPDWFGSASCHDDTRWFYPPAHERPAARQLRESRAERICSGCPVLELCRTWARAHREFGFWGGESEAERARAGYAPSISVGPSE